MAQQIDAFLDMARLQSGARLELDLERLDFAQLVRQGVEECRQAAARHRIALDAPAALFLPGDAPRLQRAVGNLLHNALKYSPDGGDIRVRLARSADGAHAELQIEDSGIGIPPQDLERVFERFQRGSNVVGRIPGTGLGLSGVRQIAEQHGGSIEAKSTVGRGTVFTLRLPAEIDLRQARVAGKVHP
jgi:signal transduction histidine kinase